METKKLTAKDFMVGDYVYRPDCYDKVVEVRKDTILGSDPLRGLIPIADLQPIPLTAEVLGKNGYASYEEDKDSFHDKSCVFIKQKDGGYGVCIDNVCTISGLIHYVHELQHALRLCGINDKEIVL